jgi:hypothetical protein
MKPTPALVTLALVFGLVMTAPGFTVDARCTGSGCNIMGLIGHGVHQDEAQAANNALLDCAATCDMDFCETYGNTGEFERCTEPMGASCWIDFIYESPSQDFYSAWADGTCECEDGDGGGWPAAAATAEQIESQAQLRGRLLGKAQLKAAQKMLKLLQDGLFKE